jgi:diguanylate cyclase (GGDEF)-like protein/PAS domain S-box-containing protein
MQRTGSLSRPPTCGAHGRCTTHHHLFDSEHVHRSEPNESRADPRPFLDRGGREPFDRITRVVRQALRARHGLLVAGPAEAPVLVSDAGLPAQWAALRETPPLLTALCSDALAAGVPLIIEDARRHPRAASDGAVDFVCFAAAPVRAGGAGIVGALCVTGPDAAAWNRDDIRLLVDMAAAAGEEIRARLAAAEETLASARLASEPQPGPEPEPAGGGQVAGAANSGDGLLAVDTEWRILSLNADAAALLKVDARAVTGRSLWQVWPGLTGTAVEQHFRRAVAEGGLVNFEEYCASLDVWVEVYAYASDGELSILVRDVTARRQAEHELRHREARYRSLFEDSRDAMYITTSAGSIVEANRAFLELLGYEAEELQSLNAADLYAVPAEREQFCQEIDRAGAVKDQPVVLRRRDGTLRTCELSATAQYGGDGQVRGYHGVLHDVTERQQEQEQLAHHAFHDALTRLPNRSLFMDRLEQLVRHARRHEGYRFAVLFLDLDRFKIINDSFGHSAGDELLMLVAQRLEMALRQEDTVARLGGDEFALILDGIQDVSDATRVADRIQADLALPFRIQQRDLSISTSIGIAVSTSGYTNAAEVLRDADTAMYRAKAGGRSRYEIYDPEMQRRVLAKLELEADLRNAVRQNEFLVQYLPVVSLERRDVVSMEALVRWQHPKRGVLMPEDFIAVAEETGLIVDIGWWVLRESCRQMRAWQEQLPQARRLTLSVNLSARQFAQQDLMQSVDAILADTRLDPESLCIEVTEDMIMQDPDAALTCLNDLRSRGIRVGLDNFGTGFSSLSHLQQLPISMLKIDRSFVRDLDGGSHGRALVQSILALAESLAVDSVAEGVETVEQLGRLRDLGARYGQGYFFSTPLDADAATRLIAGAPRPLKAG